MPSFCRHNRFVQNCPICSRAEAASTAPVSTRPARERTAGGGTRRPAARRGGAARPGDVRVRRVAQAADDGYRSPLVPGLKATADAERLAGEIAFAAGRLALLAADPPGAYGEAATAADPEEGLWLAFLIAYLAPLEDAEDPFAAIRAVHVPWASGAVPDLDGVATGPRTAHDPARGAATLAAYRAWAERSGSQAAAFGGEASWTPERRAERLFERLGLPGLGRGGRYELLSSVGALGLAAVRPATLRLAGAGDAVAVAAKRVFAIGDPLLLERRAAELAEAAEVPVAALDLALWNWSRPPEPPSGQGDGARATFGVRAAGTADPTADERVSRALGL